MNILLFLVLGGVAGWIASMLVKTDNKQGLIGDIILGVVGAVVGGLVMSFFNQPGVTGFDLYSLVVAIIGAVVFVAAGRLFLRLL